MKKNTAAAVVPVMVLFLVCAAVVGAWFAWGPGNNNSPPPGSMPTFRSSGEFVEAFMNGQQGYGDMRNMLFDSVPMSVTAGTEGSGAASEYSTTNVQVAGVDEADIVKNDGKYIYAISGQSVIILDAYPPERAGVIARIEFGRNTDLHELFLEGDRLAVIGSSYDYDGRVEEYGGIVPGGDTTFIKIYDIADRQDPGLVRTVEYEGSYSTSRKIDADIHVVLTTYPYYVPYDDQDIQPSDVIPMFRDTRGGQEAADFAPACDYTQVGYTDPDAFNSFLSIVSLPLSGGADNLEKRVIAGSSENVYASLGNLYIASTEYRYDERPSPFDSHEEKTVIYKFKLDGPRTVFTATAEVPGTVLNQFSMDEWDGYFRVATTRGHVSREGSGSTNNVYVLDPDLVMTGKLEGLAPGETIYSARFTGKRAYLVTFKKVDPFFVLDLSDPADPQVLGALKIPGYSDYLHPYDDNHVIGVGKNTVEANPGEGNFAWYQGMKIALFDVTDVTDPREMYKIEIGDRGTDSYALNDHKAFLFDRDKGLLVLPVLLAELTSEQKASGETEANDYGTYTYQGAYVYGISLAGGIDLKGRVTHLDDPAELNGGYYYYGSADSVKRSLYIGDYLYTVSDAGIKINRLGDLSEVADIDLAK